VYVHHRLLVIVYSFRIVLVDNNFSNVPLSVIVMSIEDIMNVSQVPIVRVNVFQSVITIVREYDKPVGSCDSVGRGNVLCERVHVADNVNWMDGYSSPE
jgi:hypothetical protein